MGFNKILALLFIVTLLFFGCKKEKQEKFDIAAWGDSLTLGLGLQYNSTYPHRLESLCGKRVYNGGVSGQTSAQIRDRMLSNPDKKDCFVVIWAGRNNYQNPEDVKADIAKMVASLGHKRYVVLSIINANRNGERKGDVLYSQIINLNRELESIYKDRFIDVRSYLMTRGKNVGQDLRDVENDIIPTSLRLDTLHLNEKGYMEIANLIYSTINKYSF